ncbi:MAG: class I SAM-dependent methyltransferase, partial [Candidatus Methanoperedens sp.]
MKDIKNFFEAEFKNYSFPVKHVDRIKINMIPQDFFPENFLDIGCGGGSMLNAIKVKYPQCNCYGLDISRNMLINLDQKFNPILSSVTNLPFKTHSFDLIY